MVNSGNGFRFQEADNILTFAAIKLSCNRRGAALWRSLT